MLVMAAGLRPVWYDDAGHYLVIEQGMKTGEFCYPQNLSQGICSADSPFITMGKPLMAVYAAWGKLFGAGMTTARLCTLLFSLLGFWVLYKLVNDSFSPRKAFWTCLLLIGNIQILSYGTQVLGEMPMMVMLLIGLYAHLKWLDTRHWAWAIIAPIAWLGAVLCKAYIAVPLALAIGVWWLISMLSKRTSWGIVLQGLGLGMGILLYLLIEQGGWRGFREYLEVRSSYGNEFLAFAGWEGIRFLVLKPLILLGTIALGIRIYFQLQSRDIFLGCMQGALLLFFLLSEGYDRFGMLLLFIPAIYLAEFVAAAWSRLKDRKWLRLGYALLLIVLFVQQTPYILLRDWPGRLVKEEGWRKALSEMGVNGHVVTYDQHYAWIRGGQYRLAKVVPSNKAECGSLVLKPGEWFLAGPYAKTEYQACVPWSQLEVQGQVEGYGYPCTVYKVID